MAPDSATKCSNPPAHLFCQHCAQAVIGYYGLLIHRLLCVIMGRSCKPLYGSRPVQRNMCRQVLQTNKALVA